jgi:ABC-type multidrug transport system fused ATPase/permease subunit
VDLFIPSGSIAAFVGPTGAGRSSLVQLLSRLYDPTSGTSTWDGVDLRTARLLAS